MLSVRRSADTVRRSSSRSWGSTVTPSMLRATIETTPPFWRIRRQLMGVGRSPFTATAISERMRVSAR